MNREGASQRAHADSAWDSVYKMIVYHVIIECPRHKDEICNIMDTYKTHLYDEGKRKYEMLSHEKRVIKTVHLQNDYKLSITRLEQQKTD